MALTTNVNRLVLLEASWGEGEDGVYSGDNGGSKDLARRQVSTHIPPPLIPKIHKHPDLPLHNLGAVWFSTLCSPLTTSLCWTQS